MQRDYFIDYIFDFEHYSLRDNEEIFQSILRTRESKIDSKRFFLRYIAQEDLSKYDFSNVDSLKEFRNQCLCTHLLKNMGGCNLVPDCLDRGLCYSGIKMSDPHGCILGQFDVHNTVMTYSPFYPLFYEERDLDKFANDKYFTALTFEEILLSLIEHITDFYVHVGYRKNSQEILRFGYEVFEKTDRNTMLGFILDSEEGAKIYKKGKLL